MKRTTAILSGAMLACLTACSIEPPLKLADTVPLRFSLVEMETHIETIWGIDESWRKGWWYGWDDEDVLRFGQLDYPVPTNYEARFYYLGAVPDPDGGYLSVERDCIWSTTFRRHMAVGWYDILFWSNIDSEDGTQVLLIDEHDPLEIHATTSGTSLSYGAPTRSGVYNNPEIFYAGMPKTFNVSKNPEDYDYYDAEQNLYVKRIDANLTPLVYTYLVQIVLYNNSGRISGMAEHTAVTSLADGVNVHTGHTHNTNVSVAYDMRLKRGVTARNQANADIFGGKLTTFGLCDMEPWVRSRTRSYAGSRADLANHVVANFSFSNSSDSVYMFNITDQMQTQAHGGVITIEVDVDTLKIPQGDSHGGASAFDPTVQPPDTITTEITM